MEIKREFSKGRIFLEMHYFNFDGIKLFDWIECEGYCKKAEWVLKNARWWSVRINKKYVGWMAATSHYRGRWVFHFGAFKGIDHKSVIPAAWRLFLKEAEKENVKLVAVYIPDDRADIRRLARIFKFRHFFGNLWASPLKHLKSSRSNKRLHQSAQKMTA